MLAKIKCDTFRVRNYHRAMKADLGDNAECVRVPLLFCFVFFNFIMEENENKRWYVVSKVSNVYLMLIWVLQTKQLGLSKNARN